MVDIGRRPAPLPTNERTAQMFELTIIDSNRKPICFIRRPLRALSPLKAAAHDTLGNCKRVQQAFASVGAAQYGLLRFICDGVARLVFHCGAMLGKAELLTAVGDDQEM